MVVGGGGASPRLEYSSHLYFRHQCSHVQLPLLPLLRIVNLPHLSCLRRQMIIIVLTACTAVVSPCGSQYLLNKEVAVINANKFGT